MPALGSLKVWVSRVLVGLAGESLPDLGNTGCRAESLARPSLAVDKSWLKNELLHTNAWLAVIDVDWQTW